MSWADVMQFLREERDRQGLTQRDIETKTDIPDSTLTRIFNGQVDEPRASQVYKIGKVLGIPFPSLMIRAGIWNGTTGDPQDEAKNIAVVLETDPALRSLVKLLMGLDSRDLAAIEAYVRLLRGREKSPPAPAESGE